MHKPRAFTLIEVIIALSLGALLMAGVLYIFNMTRYTAVAAGTRAEMARDAQLVLDTLAKDLAHTGAGVPLGTCQDVSCTAASTLTPFIRRAQPHSLVLLGDMPLPNSELSGIGLLTHLDGDATSENVAVQSEISGACTPYATTVDVFTGSAQHCKTSKTTPLVFPDIDVTSTTDDCFEGQTNRRTCPWALNKWRTLGNDHSSNVATSFVAVEVDGDFYTRRWSGTFTGVDGWTGIRLSAGSLGGAPTLPRDAMYNSVGGAYLSTIDRVFWSVENADGTECSGTFCRIKRKQCWGEIQNPGSATFPSAGTSFIGSASSIDLCAPAASDAEAGDGTAWETLATNVESFTVTYYQSPTTSLGSAVASASLPLIRAVDVELTIKRTPPGGGQALRHTAKQRFLLENRQRYSP